MDDLARQILDRLRRPGASAVRLLDAYHTRDPESRKLWADNPELYQEFTDRLIQQDAPARALDLARERQEYLEKNPPPGPPNPIPEGCQLRYNLALAAARGGNLGYAERLFLPLLDVVRGTDSADPDLPTRLRVDAVALLGRILKDRSRKDDTQLRPSAEAYEEAARVPGAADLPDAGTFPLINAATMWRLVAERAGDAAARARSEELARTVLARLADRPDAGLGGDDPWTPATIAEAAVLVGDHARAADLYPKVVEMARKLNLPGTVIAMRANLLRLAAVGATEPPDWIERHIGSVVVFSGHMIDSPARLAAGLPPRFPNDPVLADDLKEAIGAKAAELNATVGFCSLACGSDILFAEVMLERKAELHVVFPFARDDFVRTSVDFGLREMAPWRRKFEGVLGAVPDDRTHFATTEPYLGTRGLYDFVNTFTQGLGVLRARQRTIRPTALAVLDPGSEGRRGGTRQFLTTWAAAGFPAAAIDLAAVRTGVPRRWTQAAPAPAASPGAAYNRPVKAVLFADVAGFSRVTETQFPEFMDAFTRLLKGVFGSAAGAGVKFANTWGDGLHAVFDTTPAAAEFALALLEAAADGVPWSALGMGADVPLRVALHYGPVFEMADLFQARPAYTGQHVTRTARIEPVTVRGCVYASEQFAAHLIVEAPDRFACEAVGFRTLPKDYDRCPLYHVTRV